MRKIFAAIILILFLISCASPVRQNLKKPDTLKIAAVQLEIDLNMYESIDSFERKINGIVTTICRENKPDLIIFPEYTSTFLAITPYFDIIRDTGSYTQAFSILAKKNKQIREFRDIFVLQSENVRRIMDRVFGRLARTNNVVIIAGTYFAHQDKNIYNRAVVYGNEGTVIYTQDKVYLTPSESDRINLQQGNILNATGFYLQGKKITLTICRDSYFHRWEEIYYGSYLWIDIKGNGTEFDAQEQESFQKALPRRIANCDVPFGITVCLTGRLLNLYWEGRSSVIKKIPSGVKVLAEASSFKKQEVLVYSF